MTINYSKSAAGERATSTSRQVAETRSTGPIPWVQDHQLKVVALLSHADELIERISDLNLSYANGPVKDVQLGTVELDATTRAVVVQSIAPVPQSLSFLVGDALNALRGTLEHAIFAEVAEQRGPSMSAETAQRLEMPACVTSDGFATWSKRFKKEPMLASGSELYRRIRELQPFQRVRDQRGHPLARLVDYTNASKHRAPLVSAVRAAAVAETRSPDVRRLPGDVLKVGNEIYTFRTGEIIELEVWTPLGVYRPQTDSWAHLMREVKEIFTWVREVALPILLTGSHDIRPLLPARIDALAGQANLRAAVENGNTASAALRSGDATKAIGARQNLFDLVTRASNRPANVIAHWVRDLSDSDVVRVVSMLKPPFGTSPDAHQPQAISAILDEFEASLTASERA